ncbi:nucleotide exchange factor GrpE [Eubacteriales bacterium KG127]
MTNKGEDKEVIHETDDIPAEKLPEDDLSKETEVSNEEHQDLDIDENDSKNPGKSESTESENEDKFIRLMADFQNYKKRAEKEKSDIYSWANEKIVMSLLSVLDNFERALEHESKDEQYVEGMKLIFKQLTDALTTAGLEEINADGQPFDPNFHNAVMTCDDEGYDSGIIVEVLQKGYTLNGKLLRPSMVKVNN